MRSNGGLEYREGPGGELVLFKYGDLVLPVKV